MAIFELNGFRPELPPRGAYWIADTAAVIGRVRLRTHACVWFRAVLRADDDAIEVGERSQILEHCVLHTDFGRPVLIGSDCVVGPRAIVHGCTIGANSLVEDGAIVMNRAHLGRNCILCAGGLVTEGKEFPDNSIVSGRPARHVGNIDAKTMATKRLQALYRSELYGSKLKRIG